MGLLRWFIAGAPLRLVVTGLVLALFLLQSPLLTGLDDRVYDLLCRARPLAATDRVAVVAIDAASLKKIGPWPWPRSYLAEGVRQLHTAGADAIGLLPPLTTPEWNPGLSGLRKLREELPDSKVAAPLRTALADMEQAIDGDLQLQKALRAAGSVVLPLAPAAEWSELPSAVSADALNWNPPSRSWQETLAALHNPLASQLQPAPPAGLASSFAPLTRAAAGEGYLAAEAGPSLPLLSPLIHNQYFPGLPLQLLRQRAEGDAQLSLAENRIRLGDKSWSTGDAFRIRLHPLRAATIPVYPFAELVAGTLDPSLLVDRAVVVGLTDTSASAALTRGVAAATAELIAGQVQLRPAWAFLPELAALLFFALFLVLIIPRLSPWLGGLLLLFFVACWGGVVAGLLISQGFWLQLAPALLLVLALGLVVVLQRLLGRRASGYEDLKLLGLSLQGQGMLDMAFDKFMQCPVSDPSVREILYNLGLDFERKRMFNKAVTVYQHLLKGGKFKDAKQKVAALQATDGTVVLGAGGKNGGLSLGQGRTAPTLGRYEVVRELGQGAMGTVYLGRDPKINREVAIKTLNIRDIEPQQVEEVKSRFYREAEAAGGLNHPNIVTIYDAGEEHDLAYMAMEFLSGTTLSEYCVKAKLLPPAEVLRIAAEIADALAYAHDNNVIHRDIKPANIMLLDGGKVKVTDFGIARVMSASHTQTGTILGTPSYMSPEQVAGKKVDGRSDLFSLGVVCYELLSGSKPFTGDNLGALMFNISKAEYPPLQDTVKRLPKCVYEIVGKLLNKGVTARYKSACEVAQALRDCAARMKKP